MDKLQRTENLELIFVVLERVAFCNEGCIRDLP